ncbi:MAG: DUF6125 family protein [Desulfomonilia bacterium]|nr:DUF6125 family protein [Desulfomonilia bacterium]
MFPIEQWSKERVHSVMMELLYSLNYMWFLMEEMIKKHCPEDVARDGLLELSEQFGAIEAKRLEKTLLGERDGIDRLIQFLEHSHWAAFEDVELTRLSDTSLRMRTRNCTAQKAAKKWGMDFYECGPGALRLRSGFFQYINPNARVHRVFSPPDEAGESTPPEVSCEWIISLEDETVSQS